MWQVLSKYNREGNATFSERPTTCNELACDFVEFLIIISSIIFISFILFNKLLENSSNLTLERDTGADGRGNGGRRKSQEFILKNKIKTL